MSPEISTALLLGGAYLLGGIPFGLLLGLLGGVDIRKTGSGNIGATNLARALGRGWGVAAFALDYSKGLLPVLAAAHLSASHPDAFLLAGASRLAVAAGVAAILGHVFPPYLAFRGGKGVATGFGVVTALSWPTALGMGILWLGVYLLTRTVSIASMAAGVALPVLVLLFERGREDGGFVPVLAFAAGAAALILIRHRSNFRRLLKGEELRVR
jgi:glycerol-3-phosphate acyltransferase PlsY